MPLRLPPLPSADLDHVLAHTRDLWGRAGDARLFITGGTGFFGMWLLETLAHANDRLGLRMEATVLTRDPASFARRAPHLTTRGDLKFVAGDVRSFAPPAGPFTHVIHAATTSSAPVAPAEMEAVITDGTRRVLEMAQRSGARRLLYVSSGAVYGPQPSDLTAIPEDFAGVPPADDPAHAYGRGKRTAEQLCLAAWRAGGPEPVIARCFAFVGPHLPLDAHFAAGNFLRDALAGSSIRVAGDGTPLRSYLHAADLAGWLWTLLFSGVAGRAYNVGSDEAVSIAALARAVAALRTPALPVQIARAAIPGQPPARYVPDTTRARAELGLAMRINLAESLGRTYRWHTA
jgi:nucleoside-diphosphate-sugar epimerase